jgi:hypothetical protein
MVKAVQMAWRAPLLVLGAYDLRRDLATQDERAVTVPEVAMGDACGGQGAPPAGVVLLPVTYPRRDGTKTNRGCPGRGSLSGMVLDPPELVDRDGQGAQVRDERGGDQRGVACDLASHCDQPRGGAQLVPRAAGRRYTAVAGTGSAVVTVSGPLQVRAAQRLRRGMQNIGRRPGSIRGLGRVVTSGVPDVLRSGTHLTGRVLEDRVLFRGREPERPGTFRGVLGRSPAAAKPGQGKPGRQSAAALPHRRPRQVRHGRAGRRRSR